MSVWFDYNAYMTNKLAQVTASDPAGNWTMDKVAQAFADLGYVGIEGAERHFMDFGQNEDVAPNAFFNPTEYYRAKAAQAYGKDYKAVTDADAALVKAAIKGLGMNAWSHYDTFGSSEGVNPSNAFDTDAYMNAKMTALNAIDGGKKYTLPEVYAAFQASGISALEHFMTFGGNGQAGEVTQKYDPQNPAIPTEFAVPDSKKVNPGGGVSGNTYTLTENIDNIVGTSGDDHFIGDAKTASAADQIDGRGGNNTLTLAGTITKPTFSNIQNIVLDQTGAQFSFDVSTDTSVKSLTVKNTAVSTGDSNITVGTGQSVSLNNVQDAASDNNALNINAASVTSLDLSLDRAGNAAKGGIGLELEINSNTLKTLNVTTSGNASRVVMIDQTADLAIDKMVIAGDQALNWTMADSSAAKVTIDGSAAKGALTLTLAADDYAITGGSANDTFIFGGTLTDKDTINGGDGTDYVSTTNAFDGVAATMANKWTSIEGLTFASAGASASAGTLDVSAYTNIDLFKFQGFGAASGATAVSYGADLMTVSGLTSAENLTFSGFWGGNQTANAGTGSNGANEILTLTAKTAYDTVDLTLDGASFLGNAGEHGAAGAAGGNTGSAGGTGATTMDFSGVHKTITIESIGDTANVIKGGAGGNGGNGNGGSGAAHGGAGGNGGAGIKVNAGQMFVITGDQDLTIDGGTGGTGGTAGTGGGNAGAAGTNGMAFSSDVDVNAADFTGKLKISGSTGADKIVGGKGNDTIRGGSGGDFMTGGEGADTFVFAARTDSEINTATNMDIISDFISGTDKIGVASAIKTAVGNAGGLKILSADSGSHGTLGALLTSVVTGTNQLTANGAALVVVTDGTYKGSYLVMDGDGSAAAFAAGSDYCIQLNGVTSLTAADFVAN